MSLWYRRQGTTAPFWIWQKRIALRKQLKKDGIKDEKLAQREIVAMIAYLQRLGTDIKVKPATN